MKLWIKFMGFLVWKNEGYVWVTSLSMVWFSSVRRQLFSIFSWTTQILQEAVFPVTIPNKWNEVLSHDSYSPYSHSGISTVPLKGGPVSKTLACCQCLHLLTKNLYRTCLLGSFVCKVTFVFFYSCTEFHLPILFASGCFLNLLRSL